MWIATTEGFISAVQHRDDPNLMMVRARSLADLDTIFPDSPVTPMDDSDYPFRVTVTREHFAEIVCGLIGAVDYPNFKSAVHAVQGVQRANTYHDVWEALLAIEDEPRSGVDHRKRRNPYAPFRRRTGRPTARISR